LCRGLRKVVFDGARSFGAGDDDFLRGRFPGSVARFSDGWALIYDDPFREMGIHFAIQQTRYVVQGSKEISSDMKFAAMGCIHLSTERHWHDPDRLFTFAPVNSRSPRIGPAAPKPRDSEINSWR
jgi:hypothetical protein